MNIHVLLQHLLRFASLIASLPSLLVQSHLATMPRSLHSVANLSVFTSRAQGSSLEVRLETSSKERTSPSRRLQVRGGGPRREREEGPEEAGTQEYGDSE